MLDRAAEDRRLRGVRVTGRRRYFRRESDLQHLAGVRSWFDGDCGRCPRPILVDQRIVKHGDGWIHASCANGGDE